MLCWTSSPWYSSVQEVSVNRGFSEESIWPSACGTFAYIDWLYKLITNNTSTGVSDIREDACSYPILDSSFFSNSKKNLVHLLQNICHTENCFPGITSRYMRISSMGLKQEKRIKSALPLYIYVSLFVLVCRKCLSVEHWACEHLILTDSRNCKRNKN